MNILFLFFIFILGLLIGSFLNVVILRYKTGLSLVNGRSFCFNCNHQLEWFELIPLFSYLFLGGKCRKCKSPISLQYPLVEFLTGIFFVALAIRQYYYWYLFSIYTNGLIYSILFFVYYCVIFSILTVISVYDLRHKIIPQLLVYLFIGLSVFKLLLYFYCFVGLPIFLPDILDLVAPIILSLPFVVLWVVSSGRWIGLGDAQLAFGIGAMLGFSGGLSAIVLAFWIGAIWAISIMIIENIRGNNRLSMKSEVPFAPFLIIATIVIFFTHMDVLGIDNLLSVIQ